MLVNLEDAVRMLRDDWGGPYGAKQLAEELYAILTANGPATSNGPATFTNSGTDAPITIGVPALTGTFPAISFVGPQGQPLGSLDIVNGMPTLMTPGGTPTTLVGGGGNAFGATVLSGGPGNGPYVVQLKVGGLKVNATQLQIDPGATIPAGTSVIVVKELDGTWSMQVPVWLIAS